MDFLELLRTQRGNRYLLVVTDYFTRWVEAFALPDQKSETVARALVDGVITRHGVPHILHSDQGGNFESNVIKGLRRILDMDKVRTSPYHPQCDGLVERLNRTIIDMLAKYCSKNSRDWDLWLQVVVGAYRSAPHSSTGYSPAELVYGRSLRLPSVLLWDEPLQHPQEPQTYIEELKTSQRAAREVVEAGMTAAQERQSRNYNGNARGDWKFQIGDLVYKTNPHVGTGQSSKIRDRFVGPYRVIRLKGDTNYIIQHLKGGHRQCVHRNRLRPCYQRRKGTADKPTADNQDSDPASEPETDSAMTVQQEVRWNPLTAPEIEEFECAPMDVDRDQEFGGDRNQDEDPDANND